MKKIKTNALSIAIILGLLLPFIYIVKEVLSGNMAFWYDPARDLLLGLGNLSKVTLIGPTSGIPGIFYGPYWVWLLSFGLFFSKDPRIVTLLTETIPYFVLFPLLLFQFRKIFSLRILLLIWLVFIFNYNNYAIQLWNPHLAPLLFLAVLYLITFTDFAKIGIKNLLKIAALGFITALTVNFHISFGLGLTVGVVLYLFSEFFMRGYQQVKQLKKILLQGVVVLLAFGGGFLAAFLPFIAFEVRHGFQQTHVALQTLTSPVPVVGLEGLSDIQILQHFFGRMSSVFFLPQNIMTVIGIGAFVYLLYFLYKKKFNLKEQEVKLFILVFVIALSVLLLYLTAKNPVWNYHFIAVEIIFLFILAFFAKRFTIFEKLLMVCVAIIFVMHTNSFIKSFAAHPYELTSLATKEYMVSQIMTDAKNTDYTVYIYNPAIYNYDYAYLFQKNGKDVPYDPGMIPGNNAVIYLIFPADSQKAQKDFINYRTPETIYKTVRVWQIPDGSTIIKRIKINKT